MGASFLQGKRVLVTGGTGSIGQQIVRKVLAASPEVVRLFSRDESKQFEAQKELARHGIKIRFLIGDIRDRERVEKAFEDVDVVFHAAAMKHVPACEFNPFEAIKTNVLGTQHCIDAALAHRVERFVTISTDKATNPTSTMGCTKLLAERLTVSANAYKGPRKSRFCAVRFGNVIGSRGSVIPHFVNQIRQGGPVTITHREMTRFIMTIPQAVDLVIRAAERASGGELFVLKMPVVRIRDLAEVLIEAYAPVYNRRPSDIEIVETGIRAGERLHEALLTQEEAALAEDLGDMWAVRASLPAAPTAAAYLSSDEEPMEKTRIIEILAAAGLMPAPLAPAGEGQDR